MLARARRLADLEGSARVRVEPPAAFFAAAEAEYPNAPVWVGELYLELHRATYTSQAATKRGNRRSEHLLREAELWAATAAVRTGAAYPYDRLDRLWKTVLLHQFHDSVPGGGAAAVSSSAAPSTLVEDTEGWTLDNGLVRVRIDRRGLITSVLDLPTGRETVPYGRVANLLQLHPDLPNHWDAWDVDSFYRNRVTDLTGVEEITADPATCAVTVVRAFRSSRATQTISLAPGARRVDLTTEVDWHESEKFLKAAFPLDVHADRCAAETQFGHLYRATHTNTSWDAARFEICAHRWIHVGETGWGAALVNDAIYGHDVTRENDGEATITTVRLSLLRAPRFPDPETDQGVHVFRYALAPGAGIADAVREGYRINLPERRVPGEAAVSPLVTVTGDQAVIEAVKLADDRSGDVIVRLYESLGGRTRCELRPGFAVGAVTETDLLERPLPGAPDHTIENGAVPLDLRPFQIRTLRLHPDT
jgi:alpha-mannosidase